MSRVLPTLKKRGDRLASAAAQRELLARVPLTRSFEGALATAGLFPLRPQAIDVLQINVGKKCNQTCRHCHVDAGPDRTEVMSDRVLDACLAVIDSTDIPNVDITGGAPELHPRWRELVSRAREAGKHVIDRCNLTVTLLPNYRYLPEFLAAHQVEVVASLPHYRAKQTDTQRGEGVFLESIEALQRLNEVGYGREGTGLLIHLVTNPVGTFLPGDQAALEREWKIQLNRLYGVQFSRLYTITNMPISRFLSFLEDTGRMMEYLERLANAFNPAAAASMMCRTTVSVGWDGTLYDCDFNQMLKLPILERRSPPRPRTDGNPAPLRRAAAVPRTIFEFDYLELQARAIELGPHCYGCSAGAGSSCGGAIT